MEKNFYTDTIGIGVTFPIQLSTNESGQVGWYPVNGDFKLIRDNLSSILYYMIGQRFRQEDFGSKLWQCIEEPNSQALSFIIKEFLKQAIGTWEQRISLGSITVTRVDAKINIDIAYKINTSNTSQYLNITYDSSDNSLNI